MASAQNFRFQSPSTLQPLADIFPDPIVAKRAPQTTDINYNIGQVWVEPSANTAWILTSVVANSANWQDIGGGGGAGVFSSLVVNPGPTSLSTVGNGAVTIGNATNTGAITIHAGAGGFTLDGDAGTINIGADAAANDITIGTITNGAITDIFGGNGTGVGTSAIEIGTAPTGDIQIGTTTHTGTIRVGVTTAAGGETIDIGSSAAPNIVVLGSTNGAAQTIINGGTAGISILPTLGNIGITPATGTAASPTASVTMNDRLGVATFTGFTTANSGGAQAFTITNSKVLATSACLVTVTNLNASTNGATMEITGITQAVGSLIVHTANNGAGALGSGDNVLITFWVLN